ncbi:MAG: hypothetical protein GX858_02235 [Clostridiales bacterium]|nr:hypothetical protein [Clostridiales bacterium]
MSKLSEAGKRMLFWGSLLLFVWAGYELSVRYDTLSKSTNTVYLMAKDLNASLIDVLFKYQYYEALKLPIFLFLYTVFALLVFIFRRKPTFGYVSIPVSLFLIWTSFDARVFFSRSLWEMLKLLPLLLIILGSFINLIFYYYIRKRRKEIAANLTQGGRRFQ